MLRHKGDGFHTETGGNWRRDGQPAPGARIVIMDREKDRRHVNRLNRAGGYPVNSSASHRLLGVIDACRLDLGDYRTRRLLLAAARVLARS